MALYDPRKFKQKKKGSNWVGGNSTWVGRDNKIIAPSAKHNKTALFKERAGDDIGKTRRNQKGRANLLAGVKNLVRHVGSGLSMAKGPTNRKPTTTTKKTKKRKSRHTRHTQWYDLE
jgi:hypothetical protein